MQHKQSLFSSSTVKCAATIMTHPITTFLIYTYSAVFNTLVVLVAPVLRLLPAAKQWNIKERSSLPHIIGTSSGKPAVWIHAASLGEAKLLLTFLDILEKKHSDQQYVLTATTKNGVHYLAGIQRKSVIAVGFLPFDTLSRMRLLLHTFSIQRVWIMETELWPSMLYACIGAHVPIGIVNARMEQKSFTSYKQVGVLFSPLFARFDSVLAQSKSYANRFIELGLPENAVTITGNLKSLVPMQAVLPSERNTLRARLGITPNEPVLTAGCIHVGEGTVLREALALLAAQGLSIKCIVVPRYPDKAETIIHELGESLLLHDSATTIPWNVCCIAKVGILDDMYKLATVAFIGGTFVPVGGHNVWDAARHALPVIFGPDYHTQHEGCTQLLEAQAGFCVKSASELAEQLYSLVNTGTSCIPDAFQKLNNAMDQRIKAIEDILP